MRTFTQKHDERSDSINTANNASELETHREIDPALQLQRLVGNHAIQHPPHSSPGEKSWNRDYAASTGTALSLAGGDAPVPTHPLTEEERLIDLQSTNFKDDDRLQKAFDNNPPIGFGAGGPAVEKLQQALLDLGFMLPKSTNAAGKPDGIFGQETHQVVKGFQWRQGIVQDGIVGRQTLGELDGLLSGQTAPGTGASGPETPGTEITVTEVELSPKQFGTCGGFTWKVDWNTNARNGYIVQEIVKEHVVDPCGGAEPALAFTPSYWEAWRVQIDGSIHGTSGADDDWINPSADGSNPLGGFPGTKGRWRTTGKVFFVNQLDPKAGFKVFNVPDAGSLWSTRTKPENLGKELLARSAGDTWDCCGGGGGTTTEKAGRDSD